MTYDTMVTIQGWLGNDPQLREAGGASVANFRVGCTPRRYHRGRQEWVDGPTQWYGVSAWRALGEHCKRSLHLGDPVIVHGRLSQRRYLRDGVEVTVLEIEATAVGHDLTRGVSSFSKTVGTARRDERAPAPTAAEQPETDPWTVSTGTPAGVSAGETPGVAAAVAGAA